MNKYNNKQVSFLWSGRVYVTYNQERTGANICIDPLDDDEFMVLAYVQADRVTESGIRAVLESCGYDPDVWLK